jgi:hypothetical protein
MRFLLGPLIIVLGVAMMKYSFWITQQTGKIDFAERYLQSPLAGTYTWWKLVGLILIALALGWMGGLLDFGAATTTPGI